MFKILQAGRIHAIIVEMLNHIVDREATLVSLGSRFCSLNDLIAKGLTAHWLLFYCFELFSFIVFVYRKIKICSEW